jgi:hypothetical protein
MGYGKKWALGCVVAASVLWAGNAAAEPETHDGFHLRLGLNFGPVSNTIGVEAAGQEQDYGDFSGFTTGFDLLIGGSPVQGLAIGGALITTYTADPSFESKQQGLPSTYDGTMLLAGVGLYVDWYPDPNGGGHVQGLLGYAAVDFVTDDGQSGSNDPSGPMLGIGGGYDFWVGDEWSIGPFARILYAPVSYDSALGSYKNTYLYPSIGVGFTYH